MRHITPLLITLLAVSAPASADVDFTFNNGSAIVLCQRSEGIAVENFNKAFTDWSVLLQKKHSDGSVEMVQFTEELNKGVFILVSAAEKAQDNVAQAETLMSELNAISKNAGIDTVPDCRVIPLGPVWLAPTQ